jgi:anti-anti-sigma regulatory factor
MAEGRLGTAKPEQLGPSLWVLNLVGEHDLSTAPLIDAAFRPIQASGTTVVVDFSEASFVDSTVVNSLTQRATARRYSSSRPKTAPFAGHSTSSESPVC